MMLIPLSRQQPINMKKFLAPIIATMLLLPSSALAQTTIVNPLGTTDVRLIIARIIQGVISITGALVLATVLYGGILWMTSMGNPAQVTKGKQVLIWSILGFAVIASAYVITNAVINAILTGSVSA